MAIKKQQTSTYEIPTRPAAQTRMSFE